MDERSHEIVGRAGVIAFSFGVLYSLTVAIWKLVSYRSVEAASSEIIFVVVVCAVFALVLRADRSAWLPRVTSDDPEELESRPARMARLRRYARNGLPDALAFVAATVLIDWFTGFSVWTWLISLTTWQIFLLVAADIALTWAIFFAISWWTGERAVRRYVNELKELDA